MFTRLEVQVNSSSQQTLRVKSYPSKGRRCTDDLRMFCDYWDPADHDYCRFQSVLLVDQITVIENEMCV